MASKPSVSELRRAKFARRLLAPNVTAVELRQIGGADAIISNAEHARTKRQR
ncbi:hypothetical protein ACFYOY_15705 [Streptomyces sp. NPDC007875]|uniref:hypothetical protein n=1 Tax=Streptomyces sp. NPDC007875 TaxID=3364783 RepID=UPI00367BD342